MGFIPELRLEKVETHARSTSQKRAMLDNHLAKNKLQSGTFCQVLLALSVVLAVSQRATESAVCCRQLFVVVNCFIQSIFVCELHDPCVTHKRFVVTCSQLVQVMF